MIWVRTESGTESGRVKSEVSMMEQHIKVRTDAMHRAQRSLPALAVTEAPLSLRALQVVRGESLVLRLRRAR